MRMIKNGWSERRQLSAGKPRVAAATGNRKKVNEDLNRNYAFMLQMYVIAKNERIRKNKLKPVTRFANYKKTSSRFSLLNSSLIVNVIRPFFGKVGTITSRIYSAIEISYQSLIG